MLNTAADAPGLTASEALCGAYARAVCKMEDEGDILSATKVAAGSLLLKDGRQFRVMVDLIPDERLFG